MTPDCLMCTICWNPYSLETASNPLIVACGHSFCYACLETLIKNSRADNKKIECPTCRKFILKKSSVTDLPKNYAVLEMLVYHEQNKVNELADVLSGQSFDSVQNSLDSLSFTETITLRSTIDSKLWSKYESAIGRLERLQNDQKAKAIEAIRLQDELRLLEAVSIFTFIPTAIKSFLKL